MKSNRNRIQELKNNGYNLQFETVFNFAFENYKKIAIYAGLLLLVLLVFFGIAASIILAFSVDIENLQELSKLENFNPKNLSDEFLAYYLVGSTLFSCIISPIYAGFIKMAHCAQIDEEFHVSTVFEYYRFSYFKELFMATLLITVMSLGISSLFNLTGIPVLGLFGSITISLLSILSIPLIIFDDYKAFEAINTSFNLISKQPLVILGLFAVGYLFSMVGLMVFIIGLLFTLPLMFSLYYAIYSIIIGHE
ncbi:DUF2189 domain-containing protein [Flavobacterium seoulense]|uniref:Beta-carotene 15,15'-monooxygenase n=1 Tax=Flavobacterium seoulense TaxID=1492738 RepID=A0A066WIX5_9FLAO|nr:hypothetical protein [Flavobacterium seoulense]KDN53776.1 hypothetical protein FEM21_30930 [Flavobacterium seoulense]